MAINFYGGQPGRSFRIEKIFTSAWGDTDSLKADLQNINSPVPVGTYVLVSYGIVDSDEYTEHLAEDEKNYNATIWIKDYDVEGAQDSIEVEDVEIKYWMLTQAIGATGAAAGFGDPTAVILDTGPGTPEVTITATGSDLEKVFNFEFSHLEGKKGNKGDTGSTFLPNVTDDGDISWSKVENPQTIPATKNIRGPRGYSIDKVEKSGSVGLVDTYEVSVDDDDESIVGTFNVTNGAAAGYGAVTATAVDDGPGTPEAHVTTSGPETAKNFAFTFNHLEGKVGQAAGFGTPIANIVDNVPGTPSVEVSASGADTAKVFDFKFHHLKGEQGYSINDIAKTGTDVLEDTYTVYRNDASSPVVGTFIVTNGDGIVKSELLEDYRLKLTYDSGKEVTIGPIRGAQGKPFTIDVRYSSVAEMQADFSHRAKGDYAMIQTSVEEPDNAKLYYRDDTEWVFMGDFSGATGIKGDTGAAAGFGSVTATVGDNEPGTPSVSVGTSGLDTAKNFAFTFNHIKGQKGDTGSTYVPSVSDSGDLSWVKEDNPTAAPETKNIRGPQGIQGIQGYSIAAVEKQSSVGLIDTYNVKINDPSSSSIGTFTVTNGVDGINADIVKTEYALSETQVQPTTGWSEVIPVLISGYYLWTRITWVNDDITYLVSYQGLDGTGTGDMQSADYDRNNLVISAGGIQEYIASHIEVDEENDTLVFNFGQS